MPKKIIDVENQTVTFDFGDEGTSVLELARVPEDTQLQLMLHGASQKGGDSYAGAKSATEDSDMTPEEWAKAQVESVIDQLYKGDWSTRVAGAGTVTDLARALHVAMADDDISLDDCVEKLSEASKEEKAELRKHPAVKAELDRIRLERAAAKAEESANAASEAPPIQF